MEIGPELPQPGETLEGKYEIVRLLGRGGMGLVYEAVHQRLKQRVAIKMLKPELLSIPDCVARFEREGRAAARLTSPHVARVFDVDTTASGIPFLVIEFLEGHDLSAELYRSQTLPVDEGVDILLQSCSAMAEAHAFGVVHRDLKPANLFLCANSARTVKVLDFGISKVFADEDMANTTTPSLALGTPHYMSPEQILASKDVDAQADIWSLGVILYKVLSGRLPFEGDSPTALVVAVATHSARTLEDCTHIPPPLADAVMKALSKDKKKRWQCVDDFARAIAPFGSGKVAFIPVAGSAPRVSVSSSVDQPPTLVEKLANAATHVPIDVDVQPTMGNWTHGSDASRRARWRLPATMALGVALVALSAIALVSRGRTVVKPSVAGTAPSQVENDTNLAAPSAQALPTAPVIAPSASASASATASARKAVPSPSHTHVPRTPPTSPPSPPPPVTTAPKDPLHL